MRVRNATRASPPHGRIFFHQAQSLRSAGASGLDGCQHGSQTRHYLEHGVGRQHLVAVPALLWEDCYRSLAEAKSHLALPMMTPQQASLDLASIRIQRLAAHLKFMLKLLGPTPGLVYYPT